MMTPTSGENPNLTAAQQRDVAILQDVAAKLTRLYDIFIRAVLVGDTKRATVLWEDFDSVTDDLGVVHKSQLRDWDGVRTASIPQAIREPAKTVIGSACAVLQIRRGSDGDWPRFVPHLATFLEDNDRRDACEAVRLFAMSNEVGKKIASGEPSDTPRRKPRKRRRGRPKLPADEVTARLDVLKRWSQAKERKSAEAFCTDETALGRKIDRPTLEKFVNWNTQRETRKAQRNA